VAPLKRFRKSTHTADERGSAHTLIVEPSHVPCYTVPINLQSLFIDIVKLTGEVAQRLQLEIAVMEADQPARDCCPAAPSWLETYSGAGHAVEVVCTPMVGMPPSFFYLINFGSAPSTEAAGRSCARERSQHASRPLRGGTPGLVPLTRGARLQKSGSRGGFAIRENLSRGGV
jgi:hypothetical protein